MPTTAACPDKDLLERFLVGQVPAAERPALEQHLEQCTACTEVLQSLRPADALLHTLRSGVPDETVEDTPVVRDLMHRVETMRPPHADEDDAYRTMVHDVSAGPTGGGKRKPTFAFLAPPEIDGELGRLAHYRILKQLGAGGMGMVFLAEDADLQRQVALKVMLPEAANRDNAGARFLREARLTASIKNDHIVTIHQVGEDRGVPFLAMELLHGAGLDEWMRQNPQPKLRKILRFAREIAQGLAAAHQRGLIHRDIKPANIWVEAPNDRIKILDFGLARQAEGGENLTHSGTVLGTPAYMAPEQAEGQKVDARADLFSLGCVLYRLSTGQQAFQGPSVMSILKALATHTPPPVSQLRAELPPRLTDLVSRLLAKEAAGRPASAQAVADEIAAIESALASAAKPAAAAPRQPAAKPAPKPAASDTTEVLPERVAARSASPARTAPAPSKTPPKPGAVPAPLKPAAASRSRLVWIAAAALLLLVPVALIGGGLVLFGIITRVPTAKGTLIIESDDPNVEVIVKGNGAVIRDLTGKREIELKVGDYEIELAEAKEGLKLSTHKFSIIRNGKETVRVRLDRDVIVPPARDNASSAFAKLLADEIPKADRFTWQPKEVVAVIGEHRHRHFGPIVRVQTTPDGATVVTLGQDGARVWDGRTLEQKAWIRDASPSSILIPDGKRLVARRMKNGRLDNFVACVDLTTPEPRVLWEAVEGIQYLANYLVVTPDGKTVFSLPSEDGVFIWDIGDKGIKLRGELKGAGKECHSIALSRDGKWLAVGNKSATAYLWRVTAGEPGNHVVLPLQGKNPIDQCNVAFWPDNSKLAVSSTNGENWVWDLSGPEPKQLATFPFPPALAYFYTAFYSDNKRILTVNPSGPAMTHDVSALPPPAKPLQEHPPFWSQANLLLGVNKRFFGGCVDGRLDAWDETDAGIVRAPLPSPRFPFYSRTTLSPDGNWLVGTVTHESGDKVALWSLRGSAPKLVALPEDPPGLLFAVFSADGTTLVMRTEDSFLCVWKLNGETAEAVTRIADAANSTQEIKISPNGRLVAMWDGNGNAKLLDLAKPTAAPQPLKHPDWNGSIRPAVFSADSKRLAATDPTQGHTATVFFWDTSGPQPKPLPLRKLDPEREKFAFQEMVADSSGQFLAFGGSDQGHVMANLSEPPAAVPITQKPLLRPIIDYSGAIAVSADGRTVASQQNTGRIIVYDRISREMKLEVFLPSTQDVRLQLTADGRGLAITPATGVVYLLRVPAGAMAPAPLDAAWLEGTKTLKGEQQVGAVNTELVRRNPWYEDKPTATYIDQAAVSLKLVTDDLTDLTPLAALPKLKTLSLRGSAPGKSRLRDLSPLKELKLEHLQYDFHGKEDRAAVRALTTLQTINGQPAADFWKAADAGMP